MEECDEQKNDDDSVNEELYPADADNTDGGNDETKAHDMDNNIAIDSEFNSNLTQSRKADTDSKLEKRDDHNKILHFQDKNENDVNVCADDDTPSSEDKDNEGNLLNSVVTMHNITNCDDDYSPTLAICDIFNKSKDSPVKSTAPTLQNNKDDENKDEFLIIDLDTCQMERATKKIDGTESVSKKQRSLSPPKDLVLVNLAQDNVQPDFLHNENDSNDNKASSETNFLLNSNDSDSQYEDLAVTKTNENCNENSAISQESLIKEHIFSQIKEDKPLRQYKLLSSDADIKRENRLQNKGILFQDISMSDESMMSKELYSADVGFSSGDLSDVCFNSNQNQEIEPVFYMPELYSRHYEEDKNDQSPSYTKLVSHGSRLETHNDNEFYEYAINDTSSFDVPFSSNQFNNTKDFYNQQRIQNVSQYNFESKIISNLLGVESKDTSLPYSSRHHENTTYCHKNRVTATIGSNKYSPFSTTQEHTTPFFHPPFRPTYCTTYPYSNLQQTDNSQLFSQPPSSYSDWNSWSSAAFYEVNLNTFSSSPNTTALQCCKGKPEWYNDTAMNDFYHDPEMNIKSSQAEIDSEATEDADETDDVPLFFEDSTEFSACDNLSTMSVMSSSCYSDSSSVMAPLSPSDFTPPPSLSNTPVSSNHDINVNEEQRCSYPFINENSRSEPLHLYSPTMLSVPPYKIPNEKGEPNLMGYGRNQGIKRYYPSMADKHNSRSGFSVPSAPSKFEKDDMFEFSDYRKSNKNQIQSDKISTSTSKSAYNKKNAETGNYGNQPLESYAYYIKQQDNDPQNDTRRVRHNEPLRQTAIRIMTDWYETHLDNPYPTKEDKVKMARDGGITVTQVKSWFANKRNRTNNTKPKVQKRAMKEKLKKLFQDLKHSRADSVDNSHIIQQLSGIIQT